MNEFDQIATYWKASKRQYKPALTLVMVDAFQHMTLVMVMVIDIGHGGIIWHGHCQCKPALTLVMVDAFQHMTLVMVIGHGGCRSGHIYEPNLGLPKLFIWWSLVCRSHAKRKKNAFLCLHIMPNLLY